MKLGILFCFLATACFAQQHPKAKSVADTTQEAKSSDSYAKAALFALKSINRSLDGDRGR